MSALVKSILAIFSQRPLSPSASLPPTRHPLSANLKGTAADPHVSLVTTPVRVRHPSDPEDSSFNISLISDTDTDASSLLASPTSPFIPTHSYHSPPKSPPIGLGISNLPRKDGNPGPFDGHGVVGIRTSGRRYHLNTQAYTPGPRVPASWRHGFIGSIQEEDEEEEEEIVDVRNTSISPIMGELSASKFDSRWDGDDVQRHPQEDHLPRPRRAAGSRRARGLSRTFLQELMHTWTNEDPFRHSGSSSIRTLPSIPEHEAEDEADDGVEDVALDGDDDDEGPATALEGGQGDVGTPDSSGLFRAIMAFGPSRHHRSLTMASTPPNGTRRLVVGRMRPRSMPPSLNVREDGVGIGRSSLSIGPEMRTE